MAINDKTDKSAPEKDRSEIDRSEIDRPGIQGESGGKGGSVEVLYALGNIMGNTISRRQFVTGAAGLSLLAVLPVSAKERPLSPVFDTLPVLGGDVIDLSIGNLPVNFTGKKRFATAVNGSLPAPVIRLREGQKVKIRVHNELGVDTSIHWHGINLPSNMDGVPGLSFHGIQPQTTFEYEFEVKQSGTYWYHSHSGWQEQTGIYGPLIIDPKEPEPFTCERDYVVLLSEWSDEAPEQIFANLKKQGSFYAMNQRTLSDTLGDVQEQGLQTTWQQRKMWNTMRMSPNDISDVTAYTYTYLINGQTPDEGWLGLFSKGEKIRLRFINASAMTFFDVRIPGLKMTVVAADGQLVQPVLVDEFRIGNAETYDVIVEPDAEQAYTVFAQAIDRSGYARGTLTPHIKKKALIPGLDAVPVLEHTDMGMSMKREMELMPDMDMSMSKPNVMGKGPAGFGSALPVKHAATEDGPQVDGRAEAPKYRLDDPGVGLRDHAEKLGRTVLTYAMLKNYYPTKDKRQPTREIQLHLTGNMYRYQWSIDGLEHAEPMVLAYGERVRFTLVNDTMMNHPIHLHGLWSELETGDADYIPRKHTVIVQPGSKISYLVTADTEGQWAFHCHLLYHMASMFRVVQVQS